MSRCTEQSENPALAKAFFDAVEVSAANSRTKSDPMNSFTSVSKI